MKNIFKNKRIPWALIIFGLICLVNLGLFLDYVIFGILDDTPFNSIGFNNFLYNFTFVINGVFVVYHLVKLFWKNKSSSLLYVLGSASFIIFFYIIRLCLIWY